MINDVWLLTASMISRVYGTMYVETDDCLHYVIRTNDDDKTIIGIIDKVYENHQKYVRYQFRNSSRHNQTVKFS